MTQILPKIMVKLQRIVTRTLIFWQMMACLTLPFWVSGCVSEYGKPTLVAIPASLLEILKDPVRYDGKVVQVEGIFNFELEGDAIFSSEKDLIDHNLKMAISLGLDNPTLAIPYGQNDKSSYWRKFIVPLSLRMHKGKAAKVTGVFKSKSYGGLYGGQIEVSQLTLK